MITKELQDLVWSILPKEFKEEVKKRYKRPCRNSNLYSARGTMETLELLFSIHNLTSDAEGEEMLTVSRANVIKKYENYKDMRRWANDGPRGNIVRAEADTAILLLHILFGSKCLPDEEPPLKITAAEDCIAMAKEEMGIKDEPRFKAGEVAIISNDFEHPLVKDGDKVIILSYHEQGDYYSCAISPNVGVDVDAKNLEPYAEPEENIAENRNLSQCCDKDSGKPLADRINHGKDHIVDNHEMVDRILKDGFSKERRLNLAAMALQGLLSNTALYEHKVKEWLRCESNDNPIKFIPMLALKYADALIAEYEKGGHNGED